MDIYPHVDTEDVGIFTVYDLLVKALCVPLVLFASQLIRKW